MRRLERHKTMHHQDTKDHQNMSQTSFLCESLKKFTQLALSFSLFSFIFLHPSMVSDSIHYLLSLLSNNPSQLLSAVTDKKYIFLLCNGILVFIAKYSSRTVKNQPSTQQEMMSPDHSDLIFRNYLQPSLEKATLEEYVIAEEVKEDDVRLVEAKEVMPEEELQEENTQFLITDGEREEDDDGTFGAGEYDDDEGCVQEQYENESYIEEEVKEVVVEELEEEEEEEEEEDEDEEEEEITEISTEELNRKFEEFIRKMKEELRIEAQQQLIMV